MLMHGRLQFVPDPAAPSIPWSLGHRKREISTWTGRMELMYTREDWTLFRTLATLGQKAGVATATIPALVAKELADNALDATGGCRVGLLGKDGFFVEDDGGEDGGGIPGDDAAVAALFSISRPLTSSKLLRMPTRGALGNGLRVVAGA